MGVPPNGWLIKTIPLKWMVAGYPHFRKHPYIYKRGAALLSFLAGVVKT